MAKMGKLAALRYLAALLLGAVLAGAAVAASAGQGHGGGGAHAHGSGASGKVEVTLYDESLLDQDGRSVRFVSDVIAERIVVMTFIYTTCTTVCPVISAIFQKTQAEFGERLDRDVVMVSVSVDPGTDTPERLKAYAQKYRAQPGWIFLTGGKRVVDKVLEGLGAYTQDFTAHPNMTLIGDGRSGEWTRIYGFANPDHILAEVNRLTTARGHKLSGFSLGQ